jgi:hypothetical protein
MGDARSAVLSIVRFPSSLCDIKELTSGVPTSRAVARAVAVMAAALVSVMFSTTLIQILP